MVPDARKNNPHKSFITLQTSTLPSGKIFDETEGNESEGNEVLTIFPQLLA